MHVPLFHTVYVTGSRSGRGEAARMAELLRRRGYVVTSSWHDRPLDSLADPTRCRAALLRNHTELSRADLVVALTYAGPVRESYFEMSRALVSGKPVVWTHGTAEPELCLSAHAPLVTRIEPSSVMDGEVVSAVERWCWLQTEQGQRR